MRQTSTDMTTTKQILNNKFASKLLLWEPSLFTGLCSKFNLFVPVPLQKLSSEKISPKSIHSFMCYPASRHTDSKHYSLLCRAAGHEKRRGEQLKWSLAFSLYIGSFPCAQLSEPVHTARLGRVLFCVFSLGLYFVNSFVFL